MPSLRIEEHANRYNSDGRAPIGDIGIEGYRAKEHVHHVRHGRGVPPANVLVEGFCTVEHAVHVRHHGHVPSSDFSTVIRITDRVVFCETSLTGSFCQDARVHGGF